MASLEYVMAGLLRSRRLTVALVCAGRGCGGHHPQPLPHQGGGLGPGDLLLGGGRLGRRGGVARPVLPSFTAIVPKRLTRGHGLVLRYVYMSINPVYCLVCPLFLS